MSPKNSRLIQLFVLSDPTLHAQNFQENCLASRWTVKHNNFLGVIRDTSENKEHIVGILLSCNVKERYLFKDYSACDLNLLL